MTNFLNLRIFAKTYKLTVIFLTTFLSFFIARVCFAQAPSNTDTVSGQIISVPCEGKIGNQCKFDSRSQFYLNGEYIESVTAYGKAWNWDMSGTGWINNAFDLTSIPKYANGPCQGRTSGTCTFDTRSQFYFNGQYLESITAYGRAWNWDLDGTPWPNNGFDLTSVARYANGPCQGRTSGTCTFDTRAQFNGGESITAYGRIWTWDAGGQILENGGDLAAVPRYAAGPCQGKAPGTCVFDTRAQSNIDGQLVESVTAYGKAWNWSSDGAPWPGNGFDLIGVARYSAPLALYVRISPSLISAGSVYLLNIREKASVQLPTYSEGLERISQDCYQAQGEACSQIQVWQDCQGNIISVLNGLATDSNTSCFADGIYKFRYRPKGSNWHWSNPVQLNVNLATGLYDARAFWNIPDSGKSFSYPALFEGTNNLTGGVSFQTIIGFHPAENTCGEDGRTMYFIKDNGAGYWGPGADKNLLWHVINWRQGQGWNDEYLWAWGHQVFTFVPGDLSYANNFKILRGNKKYDSLNSIFPPYALSSRWLGEGWGIDNKHRYSGGDINVPLCSIQQDFNEPITRWIVHADMTTLNLPLYKGPALRMKYYEGSSSFISIDPNINSLLREDWYFVQNLGLVKIDVKDFGGVHAACMNDPDCIVNEYMQSPHVTLTRQSLLLPSLLKGNINQDNSVNILDVQACVNHILRMQELGNRADVNGDGSVNVLDVQAIVNIILEV